MSDTYYTYMRYLCDALDNYRKLSDVTRDGVDAMLDIVNDDDTDMDDMLMSMRTIEEALFPSEPEDL